MIHYIVQSKIINKKQILLQMLKEGINYNVKDNNQSLPIDYALLNNDKEIYEILKKKYEEDGVIIGENEKFLNNFYKDSDELFKESILDSSKYQQFDDLYALVFKDCKYYGDHTHKVCVDYEYIPYNVELIRGNILYAQSLINFYKMQILENEKKDNFILVINDSKKNNEINLII